MRIGFGRPGLGRWDDLVTYVHAKVQRYCAFIRHEIKWQGQIQCTKRPLQDVSGLQRDQYATPQA